MNRATCLAYLGASSLVFAFATGCVSPDYLPVQQPANVPPVQGPLGGAPAAPTGWQPPRETVEVAGRSNVIAHWQLPATSPWLAYQKFTLPAVLAASPSEVSLPDVVDLDDVVLAQEAGTRIAVEGFPADVAFFVDLPGAASVSFAQALSTRSASSVAVIPTFNNWPAEGELVPAEETLAAMIAMPPRLPENDDVSARPVFLLDAWRLAYKEEAIDDDVVDNRYMLTTADFPTASALRAQGVNRIAYVVGSDEVVDEEDDLNELFTAYEEEGIAIYMLDVGGLARLARRGDVPWFVEAGSRCLLVRPRRTVVHDPRFYSRAHGGFGGEQLAGASGHVHGGGHGGG